MPEKPFVSVIIPVKNFARTIETMFKYLLNVQYPHDRWEIVIADGGSNDETVAIINRWQQTHPFIKMVVIPNCPSPGYARNQALKIVKGEYLFFTDADCAPCADWIDQMLKHFANDPKIAAVGGEVYTLRVDPQNLVEAWCQHFRFNMVSPRYGFIKEGYFPDFPKDPLPTQIAGHRAYFFGTCNVAYRKEALDKIGASFWERPTGEDMNLSFTCRQAGWKFYFAPQARVDHMHRADLRALRKVWVTYGQAHIPLIQSYVKKQVLEIVFQAFPSRPSLVIPFPLKGFVYIGNFHLMHIFFFLTVLCALFMLKSISFVYGVVAFGILFLYYLFRFVEHNFSMEPRSAFFTWCKLKYLTNLSFIQGGLKDGLSQKVLCIEPSF